jgi:hypothetical protein
MAMLIQFLVGGIVCVCNITIHSLVMTVVVSVARVSSTTKRSHPSLRLIITMIATVSVLMAAHVLEVFVGRWPTRLWMLRRLAQTSCISHS